MNKLQKKYSEDELIKLIAKKIVDRHLTVPSILFLDVAKPLNFMGAQFLTFFGPFIEPFFSKGNFYQFTKMLEKRENVEKILLEIETLENEKKTEK
ncbi:MAG: hypothetical protein U9N76_00525 [Candidatus Marinimicrobia bacterium]|nr:hypothetical protein [Candidatus Neomarinimicrobiota bacterium]